MRLVLAAILALAPLAAAAQAFPSKAIRIIVPFTPGSATDTMARPVAEKLAAAFGQQVLVENRPGAGGTIGAGMLAKSPPDGYTLAVVSTGHVVNPVLYSSLPYDTLKDFSAVSAACRPAERAGRFAFARREDGQGPRRDGQGEAWPA
jgi:tripartite-type tricarboxylate transporter receptor subunit TctC